MTYEVSTVEDYLKAIPEERKPYMSKLRNTILENIPSGI